MPRIRFRFVMAALAIAGPALFAGGIVVPMAIASECTDHATDNDIEYAGDNDVWCTGPGTTPTVTPTATPSAIPQPPVTPTASPSAPPVSSPPPSGSPSGVFPVAFFAPDFTGPATRQFVNQFIAQYGSIVETTYPAGSSAPSSGSPGGAQARLPMSRGPVDDATLSYQILFPAGTQFVKGGKLPGLCGGQCWTGSNNGPGGWSTRFMWRAGGAGEVLLSDATTTGYGTDLGRGSWTFLADGQWHTLTQTIHMNTPGQPNGTIDVTYNGVHVAQFTGITFRGAGDSNEHIDSLMFTTFYGGHDSTWAPTVTQHFDFATFLVS
jgi:hypothetical protein